MKTFVVKTPLGDVRWAETPGPVGDITWVAAVPEVMVHHGAPEKHLLIARASGTFREVNGRRTMIVDGKVRDIATNDAIDYSDRFNDVLPIEYVRRSVLSRMTAKLYALWCDLTWLELPVEEVKDA